MSRYPVHTDDAIVAIGTAKNITELAARMRKIYPKRDEEEIQRVIASTWTNRSRYIRKAQEIRAARKTAIATSIPAKKTTPATGADKDVAVVGDGEELLKEIRNEYIVLQNILKDILETNRKAVKAQEEVRDLLTAFAKSRS